MRALKPNFPIWVGIWALVALALCLFISTSNIFVLLALLGWILYGLCLLLVLLFRRQWREALALVALAAGLWWLGHPIAMIGERLRFELNAGAYRQIVTESHRLPDQGTAHGHTYRIDRGPPVRIAIVQGGLIDNWVGLVYDPTGEVLKAQGGDAGPGEFTAPPEIKGLFGGDLVFCERLTGSWYQCTFT